MLFTHLRNALRISHSSLNITSNISKILSKNVYPVRTFCSKPFHVVQMRGLEHETKEKDIIEFFKPLGITPKNVHLKRDGSGRAAGICEVEFSTHAEAVNAMRKKNAFLGNRFVRLTLKSSEVVSDQQKSESSASAVYQQSPTKSPIGDLNITAGFQTSYPVGHIVKMKNAPKRITDLAIYEFFWPIGVSPVSVKPHYNESGIRTGEFDIHFLNNSDAFRAMAKNNSYLRNKFVELSLQK